MLKNLSNINYKDLLEVVRIMENDPTLDKIELIFDKPLNRFNIKMKDKTIFFNIGSFHFWYTEFYLDITRFYPPSITLRVAMFLMQLDYELKITDYINKDEKEEKKEKKKIVNPIIKNKHSYQDYIAGYEGDWIYDNDKYYL